MWPFPGKTLHDEEYIYNYRHARARRVIENCFGILSACFRIFQKPIMASVQNVEKYILPYISLHNYLRQTYNAHYNLLVLLIWKISMETLYQENGDHKAKMRFSVIAFKVLMLLEVPDHGLMRQRAESVKKHQLNNNEGSVPWQIDYVCRTSLYPV